MCIRVSAIRFALAASVVLGIQACNNKYRKPVSRENSVAEQARKDKTHIALKSSALKNGETIPPGHTLKTGGTSLPS